MPTLSILIPTLNRPSLARTLASCAGADEIVLVADGEQAAGAAAVLKESGLPGRCIVLPVPYKDWGHTPRQIGMGYCRCEWIAMIDDDDYYLPDGVADIKDALTLRAMTLPLPHFFQVDIRHLKRLVWDKPQLAYGNISTDCIVTPNDKRWGVWRPGGGGDYYFAADLMKEYGEVVWVDRIIARSDVKGYGRP